MGLLSLGVILVQLDLPKAPARHAHPDSPAKDPLPSHINSHMIGLLATVICATTSGFASVYFELILKRKEGSTAANGNGHLNSVKVVDRDDEATIPLTTADNKPTDDESEDEAFPPTPRSPPLNPSPELSNLVLSNIYLSFYSICVLPFIIILRPGSGGLSALAYGNLTLNFTTVVWLVVLMQAFGGLIVSMVIK